MKPFEKKALLFKALGDPTRIKIVEMLCDCDTLCVNAIAERTGSRQSMISQHLKILKTAGLVSSSREGFHIHYRIDRNTLAELHEMMNVFVESKARKCTDPSCSKES